MRRRQLFYVNLIVLFILVLGCGEEISTDRYCPDDITGIYSLTSQVPERPAEPEECLIGFCPLEEIELEQGEEVEENVYEVKIPKSTEGRFRYTDGPYGWIEIHGLVFLWTFGTTCTEGKCILDGIMINFLTGQGGYARYAKVE